MLIYPIHVTYTIRFFLLNFTPQIINNEVPRHVIFSTLLLLSLSYAHIQSLCNCCWNRCI
jgi:hypothetical protein